MNTNSFEGEHHKGIDFREKALNKGDYENCSFSNCTFSGSDLSGIIFSVCRFENCDLSMASLMNTSFREVHFKHCKLLGLRFDECRHLLLSFSFESCVLDFSSFYKLKLKNIIFNECKLQEVEFLETDLTKSIFNHCDLQGARFENTILVGSDLRTAYNFSIAPETNKISQAKFSTTGISGLLDKYDIHIE